MKWLNYHHLFYFRTIAIEGGIAADYLEMVPMACIGGILVWVAFNMLKPAEIKLVLISSLDNRH